MSKKIQLTQEQTNYLSELPEQGMGYQVVDITLKDGTTLTNRMIINSTYLVLKDNEQLDVLEIAFIKLSKV
jgi:hypothetical protein